MPNSTEPIVSPAKKKTPWAWAVGTFFGAGLLKPGPGTYGAVAALLLWYGAAHLFSSSPFVLAIGTTIAAVLMTGIGIPASTIVARESGRKDPGFVVVDEAAGQLIALIGISADWRHAAVSLLFFRIFDILKPPPVRQFEKLPEGTGIMMDDVVAGVLALLCAHLVRFFLG